MSDNDTRDARPEDAEPADWTTLVDRSRRGDVVALNELLAELRPFVRGLAQSILIREDLTGVAGRRFDASDVTQTTLVSVSTRIGQFLGSSEPEFMAWVKTILRHDVIDCIRLHIGAQGRSVKQEVGLSVPSDDDDGDALDLASDESTPSGRMIREETQGRLDQAVKSLDPRDREIIQLLYFEKLSHAQISDRLGISVRSVSKRVEKARKKLSVLLNSEKP